MDGFSGDPTCGNGVCEYPDEYPGFGRFGCIPDCGRYNKTTLATVDLQDYFEYSKSVLGERFFINGTAECIVTDLASGMCFGAQSGSRFHTDHGKASEWDMSQVIDKAKDIHPDFRWNIWSDAMGDYIFAEPQKPVASSNRVKVLLPDGKHELRFFQYRKVWEEIDADAIFEKLLMLPNTLPNRTMSTDYGYGDKLEAISAAAIMMKQLDDYCYSVKQDNKTQPKECESTANIQAGTAIPRIDTMFKALGSYGLNGKITIPNPESPDSVVLENGLGPGIDLQFNMKNDLIHVNDTVLVSAGFCGILKNGTQGLKNRYNKINFQTAGMDCGTSRAGRRELRLSTDPSTDTGAKGAAGRTLLQAPLESLTLHPDDAMVQQSGALGVGGSNPELWKQIKAAGGEADELSEDEISGDDMSEDDVD